ncbi:hypothetical protein SynBIOSE41_01804 [Synechococcus sp. BIOS-E4-1]|nr:hypothetical protein SynBIOSE41_01804 [Synechococcus sp. BIOS-E4-1]
MAASIGSGEAQLFEVSGAGMVLFELSPWRTFVPFGALFGVSSTAFQVAKSLSVRFNTGRGKCLFLFYWCEDQ